jgi:hypothetical protein
VKSSLGVLFAGSVCCLIVSLFANLTCLALRALIASEAIVSSFCAIRPLIRLSENDKDVSLLTKSAVKIIFEVVIADLTIFIWTSLGLVACQGLGIDLPFVKAARALGDVVFTDRASLAGARNT